MGNSFCSRETRVAISAATASSSSSEVCSKQSSSSGEPDVSNRACVEAGGGSMQPATTNHPRPQLTFDVLPAVSQPTASHDSPRPLSLSVSYSSSACGEHCAAPAATASILTVSRQHQLSTSDRQQSQSDASQGLLPSSNGLGPLSANLWGMPLAIDTSTTNSETAHGDDVACCEDKEDGTHAVELDSNRHGSGRFHSPLGSGGLHLFEGLHAERNRPSSSSAFVLSPNHCSAVSFCSVVTVFNDKPVAPPPTPTVDSSSAERADQRLLYDVAVALMELSGSFLDDDEQRGSLEACCRDEHDCPLDAHDDLLDLSSGCGRLSGGIDGQCESEAVAEAGVGAAAVPPLPAPAGHPGLTPFETEALDWTAAVHNAQKRNI